MANEIKSSKEARELEQLRANMATRKYVSINITGKDEVIVYKLLVSLYVGSDTSYSPMTSCKVAVQL